MILQRQTGSRRAAMWGTAAGLAIGLFVAPATSHAQSAIIYGSLGNFDISNDTGKVCHGFEIDMDGVPLSPPAYTFSANRYGVPQQFATPTGLAVRWAAAYNANNGTWSDRTVQHTVPWFPGQCYQWTGAATYTNSGCEHFGVGSYSIQSAAVRSNWLCEDPAQPGVLVLQNPPTAVPTATYVVAPAVAPANPPQLVVEVVAPEPAEVVGQFGNAQWIRFFVTQLPVEVTLDQLVADNPAVVPMDPLQLEADYAIIQDEPAAGGNGRRKRHRHQVNLLPTTRSVVRRIETWQFTGAYDPATHAAVCADGTCTAPAANEIGNLIATQMTVALVQSDSVTVTKSGTGSGNVDSADKFITCGSKCVAPYNNGQAVTLTAKSASGSTFGGWTGACAGLGATCTVSAVGHVDVGAVFTAAVPTGGGGGGGGAGGGTTQFTLSIGRSNSGTVTGTPAGTDRAINCGSACSAKFNTGTAVTLTATPPPGKQFLNWGGACSGSATTCTVTMNASLSAQANFSK